MSPQQTLPPGPKAQRFWRFVALALLLLPVASIILALVVAASLSASLQDQAKRLSSLEATLQASFATSVTTSSLEPMTNAPTPFVYATLTPFIPVIGGGCWTQLIQDSYYYDHGVAQGMLRRGRYVVLMGQRMSPRAREVYFYYEASPLRFYWMLLDNVNIEGCNLPILPMPTPPP